MSDAPSNSPVKHLPADYYPEGDGHWHELSEGPDAGKKMFYLDRSTGAGGSSTIVFVHGNPECSYTYRKVIRHLVQKTEDPCRIVAMDHIGFGLSDQAGFEMVCMDHAANLLQLVRHLDLDKVTLVVHDWGGPIGLGALLREPGRVSNLVILNSTVFPIPPEGLTYMNYPISWLGWTYTPEVVIDRWWGDFAAYAVFRTPAGPASILGGLGRAIIRNRLGINPGHEVEAQRVFREQFGSKMNVRSSKRLVRQSRAWASGHTYLEPALGRRDTGPFYHFIRDNLTREWGPEGRNIGVRAVLGRWDPLGKDEVIDQWTQALPQLAGHVRTFEGAGHFIEEIEPEVIGEVIMEVSGVQ